MVSRDGHQQQQGEGATRRELLLRSAGTAIGVAAGGALAPLAAAAGPTGPALGFTSLREEVRLPDLPVDGRMPPWLSGVLLRNGPALFEVGEQSFHHWFDGLAMLHAFAFGHGRVSYANRFLRTSPYYAWKREGRIRYSEFATDPCRAIFSGVSSIPIIAPVPNANVSIEALAGKFVAHTEIPIPVRFDPQTLRTLGVAGEAPLGRLGTAHPHRDPYTGERFSYEVDLVPPSGYRVIAQRGRARRELAWLARTEPGYMHSFALTPRYVALFEQPLVINPLDILKPDRPPIIENYQWEASQPARIHLIDRRAGGVRATVELEPFFVFHHVNAYERGDRVVIDVCAHPDSSIIDALYLKRLRKAASRLPPVRPRRLVMDPDRGRVKLRDLGDVDFELPRINYGRFNQRPYRYAYGVGQRSRERSRFVDQLAKLDVERGEADTWRDAGCYPGEPVFVPRPGARREDDGVLLSVVLDARARSSFLLLLDARSLDELARAVVPHHIPFGFHGLHTRR